MNETSIIGNCSYQIIDSVKGKALEITGSGEIEATVNFLKLNEGHPFLSMTNYSGHPAYYFYDSGTPLPVWIYSNQSNIELSFTFYYVYFYLNGFGSPIGISIGWVHHLENFTSIGWNAMAFTISPLIFN